MINETQRKELDGLFIGEVGILTLLKTNISAKDALLCFKTLLALCDNNSTLYNDLSNQALFLKLGSLDSIEWIKKILEHDAPQNRAVNNFSLEPPGLLSLSAYNDTTALAVTKPDVLRYIREKVEQEIELLKEKANVEELEEKVKELQRKLKLETDSSTEQTEEKQSPIMPTSESLNSSDNVLKSLLTRRLSSNDVFSVSSNVSNAENSGENKMFLPSAMILTGLPLQENENSIESFPFICKMLLIGNADMCKSKFIRYLAFHPFVPSFIESIGLDFKLMNFGDVKYRIFDTAGQERFRSITSAYYREAHVLLYFANKDEDLKSWLANIPSHYSAENLQFYNLEYDLTSLQLEINRVTNKEQLVGSSLSVDFYQSGWLRDSLILKMRNLLMPQPKLSSSKALPFHPDQNKGCTLM